MTMTRSVIFGALAALGVPTVLDSMDGYVADFLQGTSTAFNMFGIWFRWSWLIFVVVTLFTFLMLQITRNR